MIRGSKRVFRLCVTETVDIDVWAKLAPDEEYPGKRITMYFHYKVYAVNAFKSAKLGKFTNGKVPDLVTLDSGYIIDEEYTCTGWIYSFATDWYERAEKTKNKDMNSKTNRADFIDSLIEEFKERYGNKTVRYNDKKDKNTDFYITSFRINKKTNILEYRVHFDGDVDWWELSIRCLKSDKGYHCHKAFNALLELLGVTKTTEVSFRFNDKDIFQESIVG